MPVKFKILTLIYFLIFILPVSTKAYSQTIAVFPVDDLSHEINSFNLLITRYLIYKLEAKGLNIVQEQEVFDFMSSRRINWLGYLDTENILQTKETLGADLILFGTMIIESKSSYGLILNMVRTKDAKTIWTSTSGLSLRDTQRLLRMNQPTMLEELWPILINKAMKSWPADLNKTLSEQ
ncbi:MAG: hypothetical protein JSV73_04660 [Flavobacteriaceae bacterium]|nr:MAG: hypothetical protein JSV73_04660 [Flavobacteriaceae bacterium]